MNSIPAMAVRMTTYVIEESQYSQTILLFHGRTNISVLFLVEHHMQFHWKTDTVDEIFAAQGIVVAPMEMQLTKFIDAMQWATGNRRPWFCFNCDHCCETKEFRLISHLALTSESEIIIIVQTFIKFSRPIVKFIRGKNAKAAKCH